jgi:DNA-binding LacI/PurR family transcriptional regulator
MSNGITMKSVAALAGVSQATVSLSLANHPRIPRATRERIQGIARQLGYCPNPFVSALMHTRQRRKSRHHRPVLAVVWAQRSEGGWRDHPVRAIREMREGAIEQAAANGFRAEEFWLHRDGISNRRFSEILRVRDIHGVLLSPLADSDSQPALCWEYFAAVSLSAPMPSLGVTTVCNDHYSAASRAMRECQLRGYRRPGMVLRSRHRTRIQTRWEAGLLVAAESGPALSPSEPLYVEDWDDPRIVDWLVRARPDVVVSPGGRALYDLLTRAGFRIPRDLGFVCLECPEADDPLSGICESGAAIGALAIDTLCGMIVGNRRGLPAQATTLMVGGHWNEGSTLRLPAWTRANPTAEDYAVEVRPLARAG